MPQLKIAKIIPIALTLVIIAVIIATLVTIIRLVAFPDNQTNTSISSSPEADRNALLDSSADRSVKMVVRGNIVADENFVTYQIEISPTVRVLSAKNGYLGESKVLLTEGNNIPAYEQFVYALDKANLTKGTQFVGAKNDLRGICATGFVYDFQLLNYEKVEKNLWTSSCNGSVGSLDANLEQVLNLFYAQLPGAENLISTVWQ